MRKLKLTEACQQRFIKALSKTGSVTNAAALAGTSRTRVYELRNRDPGFAAAWEDAEEVAADRLEDEARRRAVEGVPEPLVSGGKLVAVRRGLHQGGRRWRDRSAAPGSRGQAQVTTPRAGTAATLVSDCLNQTRRNPCHGGRPHHGRSLGERMR